MTDSMTKILAEMRSRFRTYSDLVEYQCNEWADRIDAAMSQHTKAMIDAARNECARICDDRADDKNAPGCAAVARRLAEKIRALIGKPLEKT